MIETLAVDTSKTKIENSKLYLTTLCGKEFEFRKSGDSWLIDYEKYNNDIDVSYQDFTIDKNENNSSEEIDF